jgi:hypothetical protein
MLKREFDYYLKHQKELSEKYDGKFIVIKNETILGVYDSELEAVEQTAKTEELGTFLVQRCTRDDSGYTQTFHSRVTIPRGNHPC